MAEQSVSGSSEGFGWRRFLSALALALEAGSMVVGVAIYPRLAALTLEADLAEFPLATVLATLLGFAYSLCGYVILRQTANRVGWILHGTGLLFGFMWVGLALSNLDAAGREIGVAGRLAANWLGFGWYPALMLMTVLLPLLFPTGRPPSRKWIWVAAVAAIALVYGLGALTTETLTGPLVEVLHPLSRAWPVLTALLALGASGAGISVVVRYRRANAVERLQIKWVAATFVLLCLTIAVSLTPMVISIGPLPAVAIAVFTLGFTLVPVSIAFAITKQRLYDIDRIISRTLSYAVIIGALLAVYIGALAVLTRIFPSRSDLAVAASTLGATALFNPLRRKIQGWVDRRFNRTRYIAEQELSLLTTRLRDIVGLGDVEADLLGLVHRTLQPSAVGLWIRRSAG